MYNSFLREAGVLPIPEVHLGSNPSWKVMTITHTDVIPNDVEKAQVRNKLKTFSSDENGLLNGIYVYFNDKSECLYVGKGQPIHKRIFSHYRESYDTNGRDKAQDWYSFFKQSAGSLKLCIIEIEPELDRQIIEKMLVSVLKPAFEDYRVEQKSIRKSSPKP